MIINSPHSSTFCAEHNLASAGFVGRKFSTQSAELCKVDYVVDFYFAKLGDAQKQT